MKRATPPSIATLVMLSAWVVVALAYAWSQHAPCDDAYIYFTYARNFVEGDGFTFNGMKVQGFTSPLWTGMLGVLGLSGVDLPTLGQTLSALSGVAVIVGVFFAGRSLGLSSALALIAPALLATRGDFVFYMGSGLETVMASGIVLACGARLLSQATPAELLADRRLAIGMGLGVLARPECGLFAVVTILVLATTPDPAADGRRVGWRPALRFSLITAAVVAPVVIALHGYYGYWLPNTYYAKSIAGFENLDQGLVYLATLLVNYPLFVLGLVLAVVIRRDRLPRSAFAVIGFIVLYLARITMQGGDNMIGHRLLVLVLPIGWLTIVVALRDLEPRALWSTTLIAAGISMLGWTGATTRGSSRGMLVQLHIDNWRDLALRREVVGRYLGAKLESDDVVALNSAGIIPFYSKARTVDMNGLNDEHIAHEGTVDLERDFGHQRGDGAYVLGLKPKVILFGGAGSRRAGPSVSDRQIAASEEYLRWYKPVLLGNRVWVQVRLPHARPARAIAAASEDKTAVKRRGAVRPDDARPAASKPAPPSEPRRAIADTNP